jgi:hypothetical protein
LLCIKKLNRLVVLIASLSAGYIPSASLLFLSLPQGGKPASSAILNE